MPSNVFDKHLKLKGIFKDERFLYPEHVPERLPHRNAEIDSLAFALKPVSEGKKPQNIFMAGKPGTGKTVTARFVLKELEEYSDRAKSLYINCFRVNTRHAALTEISNFLGVPVTRRGTSSDEALDSVISAFKKISFTPIIVFDELDQLVMEGEASKLFYDLLRVFEFSKGRFGLVLISNTEGILSKLDARVRSSLMPETIVFDPYSPGQLKDILSERMQFAFLPNVFEKEVIASLDEPFVDLKSLSADEKESETARAMDCGKGLIYGGRVVVDDLVGEPDGAEREAEGMEGPPDEMVVEHG